MKLTIPYTYHETGIPPRCRIPRPIRHEGTMRVTVHELTADDAPIAIVQRWCDEMTTYRWWRKRLWVQMTEHDILCGGALTPITIDRLRPHTSYERDNQQNNRRVLMQWGRAHIVIDGHVWRTSGEPRYVVMTFGLGCNHGGTGLLSHTSYNPNIRHTRYFRLDDRDNAVAEAARIAEARGDTDALPMQADSEFDILIPEAIRINPTKEHGDGDPFLNRLDALTTMKHPLIVGLCTLALVDHEMA